MEKILDFSWVMNSGLLYSNKEWPPVGWREMTEQDWREWRSKWGETIGYQWNYKNQSIKISCDQIPYQVFDLLPDETGFLVFPEFYRSKEAKILNGDLSERCVLRPVFNVRGFTSAQLDEARRARISLYGHWNPEPHFKQQVRNNRQRNDGILEVEGNDGIADCMFFFDMQSGAFVGAKPFTWCD